MSSVTKKRLHILVRDATAEMVQTDAALVPAESHGAARLLKEQEAFEIRISGNFGKPARFSRSVGVAVAKLFGVVISPAFLRYVLKCAEGQDIVLANAPTWAYNLAFARACGLLRHVRLTSVNFGLAEIIQRHRWPRLSIWLLRHLDTIIVYSAIEAQDLRQLGLDNIRFVPFGVDENFWRADPTHSRSGGYVFSPGNDPRRDWWTLIRACDAAHPLVLASKTFASETGQIPDYVRLTSGSLVEMRRLYEEARCAAVTLPESRRIAGESTVLQSMAMGLPVIVTQTAGSSPDVIRNGVTCITVPPADVAACRAALQRVWSNSEDIQAIARNGRKLVEEQFNAAQYAANMARALRGVL